MQNNNYNSQDYSGGFNSPTTPVPPYTPPPPPPSPLGTTGFNPPGGSGNDLNQQLMGQMVKNMKFVGIWNIIIGAINCITCIGAVIGIPIIFAGMRLRESAESFIQFAQSGMQDKNSLQTAFEKQNRYFNIMKILIIIGIVLVILEIIIFLVIFLFSPSTRRLLNV